MEGEKKTSLLFIQLLWQLVQHDSQAKVIHVILDNYSIHSTQQVEFSPGTEQGQRLRLHFLRPYCPTTIESNVSGETCTPTSLETIGVPTRGS